MRRYLSRRDVPYRTVRYWLERETVTSVTLRGELGPLAASAALNAPARGVQQRLASKSGAAAAAARDAFDLMWQTHADPESVSYEPVPAGVHVPAEWLEYLPFPTLNPAQAQAAPHVLDSDEHVIVTAPTGAGKTVIGMMAALRTVLGEGRKAAWLVPQRSLTDELDEELKTWRQRGLRVERLSGEYVIDAQRVREADLWVATTEKFESICRTWSMQEALAEVGCLVIDEIHLLGNAGRGPVLEALLARVRGVESPVRIVGLSATVANAGQIAEWLSARSVHITWRPSRLTWQLPTIPASSDRAAMQTARTRLACGITRMIAADEGSVLVFCGSKRSVRATALSIAGDRGADVRGVDPDDLDHVHRICAGAGVGLHYKDWEHKREAERAFRNRELDVLVATTTVAAGVNLPARAVVVRDTQLGLDQIDVAQVQQMFGRAGRVGAGESEGWAYLIVDENERSKWQARLVEGYNVSSHILPSLADHVLAEVVQGRISTIREAEAWWIQTLAYHQGTHSLAPLRASVDFLDAGGYLALVAQPTGDADITPTELGTLTARLMIPTVVGEKLRIALGAVSVPSSPEAAERMLITVLSTRVPGLAEAPLSEEMRPAIARLIQADGHVARLGSSRKFTRGGLGGQAPYAPGDLAKATLLTVANSPQAFGGVVRRIADIPYATMYPILENTPHYLNWIGSQGFLGTVPPWCAIVAADLGRRIRWRRCAPPRGSGRLLWMCEQMATPVHADQAVPVMWKAARRRELSSPDWRSGAKPTECRLDDAAYTTLLRDRLTDSTLAEASGTVAAECSMGTALAIWSGRTYAHRRTETENPQTSFPTPSDPNDSERGAALFSRRGDFMAIGWLGFYSHIQDRKGGEGR